jgi:hypothetical protein
MCASAERIACEYNIPGIEEYTFKVAKHLPVTIGIWWKLPKCGGTDISHLKREYQILYFGSRSLECVTLDSHYFMEGICSYRFESDRFHSRITFEGF